MSFESKYQNASKKGSKMRVPKKNIPKTPPKIDFGAHVGLQNPSKIEEKSMRKGCLKKCEKNRRKNQFWEPVFASEREA